jgi:hypothetical protein
MAGAKLSAELKASQGAREALGAAQVSDIHPGVLTSSLSHRKSASPTIDAETELARLSPYCVGNCTEARFFLRTPATTITLDTWDCLISLQLSALLNYVLTPQARSAQLEEELSGARNELIATQQAAEQIQATLQTAQAEVRCYSPLYLTYPCAAT